MKRERADRKRSRQASARPAGDPAAIARLSRAKRVVFTLIACLLPFLLLGLAELACRRAGYGGYPPVIARLVSDGATTWYGTNRAGTDSFFDVERALGGGMRELQWTTPKSPGTVRIVFLGESAIQGFPEPLPLTNGSFLAAMLADVWGDGRRAEVLNLGATAVASFPLRCFVDPVLAHEPDLLVVMAGNNEFYGAYGVASLNPLASSPLGMRLVRALRGLGLVEWATTVVAAHDPAADPIAQQRGTLMERMAAGGGVGARDPLRSQAALSLGAHLAAIVRRAHAAGVPIILCTSPTNERDLAPIGADRPPLSAGDDERFTADLARAADLAATDPAAALPLLADLVRRAGEHARAHYLLARCLTALGRSAEAHPHYVRARDCDTLPWRATSAAQEAVRAAAAAGGAMLCDMEAAFRAESPGGAIGWELLDDHVHMSLRGQALFARTIAATLAAGVSLPPALRVDPAALAALPGWESYAERLGHSVFSDLLAVTHARRLFAIPFMEQNNAAARDRYDRELGALTARLGPVDSTAFAAWLDPRMHGASERPIEHVVGTYHLAAGDYAVAARLFRFALGAVPALSLWRLELTWRLLTCNRRLHAAPTAEDQALVAEAIHLGNLLRPTAGPRWPEVACYSGLALNLAGQHAAAVECLSVAAPYASGADGWEVLAALADSYFMLGRRAEALRVLELAARDPALAAAAEHMRAQIAAAPAPPGPGP
jgi:tetratricopeptide (TPR) repeat protein